MTMEDEQRDKLKDERNRQLALRSAVLRAKRMIAELADAIERAEENLPAHPVETIEQPVEHEPESGPLSRKYLRRGLYQGATHANNEVSESH